MLRLKKDHARKPIGGHRFTGHGAPIKAATIDDVLAKVEEYRAANALPLGNPEHEMALQYAGFAPWLVRGVDDREPTSTQKLAESAMRIHKAFPAHYEPRHPDVILRMHTCRRCPFFSTPLAPRDSVYQKAAFHKAALFTGDLAFWVHGACTHHNWWLAMASRLREPASVALLPAPENCWVATPALP